MSVMFVIAQLVLGGVFCGNQSSCRNCRICILIGECWNGVDSLEILEHCRICRIAWKGWKVMNDWNAWNVSGVSGTTGMSGKTGMPGISERLECLWSNWSCLCKDLRRECLECLVRHTDGFLEDLLAFYA